MSEIDDVLGLAESTQPDLPDNERMAELGDRVQALIDLRSRIEKGEKLIKQLKKEELALSGETIPSIMDELGFSQIKTPEGREVSYKPFYSGKIRPESEDQAFKWIEENGHGGVIKGEVVLGYRRSQRDEVLALIQFLKDEGWDRFDLAVKLGVHHSTLRALFRELIEDEGQQPPPDLFDVFIGRKTTIK